MAQKKNKERKQKLEQFKQKEKKKMSDQKVQEQLSKLPQINQYPVWNPNEKIEVSGLEWESIFNLLNIFRQAIISGESVMQRNLASGKIRMKYVDAAGNEVQPEKVDEYRKEVEAILASQKGDTKQAVNKIVSETGEPFTGVDTQSEVVANPSADLKAV